MSMAKRLMEAQEEKARVATEIAVAAGCIKPCEYHGDVLLDMGADPTDAYKLGNYRLSHGLIERDVFDSPRDMTDHVKAAIESSSPFGCVSCSKLLED